MERVKLFVGCAPNHEDAESQMVLEHSVRSRTSCPVDITWMKHSNDPTSPFYGWNSSAWPTPFSGFRYAVPALCNFEGRAIYCDSDVIFLDDIGKLATLTIPDGAEVLAKSSNRLCVSLWDCSKAMRGFTLEHLKRDATVHYGVSTAVFTDGRNWNCLDGEQYASLDDPEIAALHYTSMSHQPQIERAIKRLKLVGRGHWFDGKVTKHWRDDVIELFEAEYMAAIAAGYRIELYCKDEPFWHYQKGSVASLQGAVPSWGRSKGA